MDVIVAVVTQASLAAKDATNSIPIVMVAVSDPVSSGLVASLRHPGAFRSRFLDFTGRFVHHCQTRVFRSAGARIASAANSAKLEAQR